LTLQIYKIVKERGLTQAPVSKILGIKQPHISTLMRNRSGHLEFLTALGQDVTLTVKPTRKAQGETGAPTGKMPPISNQLLLTPDQSLPADHDDV
jgi:transcriptional regulator with XRE-family HTH domain